MFTLKFMDQYENGAYRTHVVECPHYSIYKHSDCFEVILYPDYFTTSGVTYWVGGEDQDASQVCYVENNTGKTIDRLSVKD